MAIQDILQGKKEWKALQARAKALPSDYYLVYKEMQRYLFKVGGADFEGLIELFEQGVADGRDVFEITGRDVAAFSDDLAESRGPYYDSLQKAIKKSDGKVVKALNKVAQKQGDKS